jgi:hypothetical protein
MYAFAVILVPATLLATESNDFAIRVIGGGSYCTNETVPVEVRTDFNLTGENDREIRGYSIAICHVPYQLEIITAVAGSGLNPTTGVAVDFQKILLSPRGAVQTVVVDMGGTRGIPPANDFSTLNMVYRVEDAADPAAIWPCDRALGNPLVPLAFSTGDRSYSPPPENCASVEITSACQPVSRTFHLRLAAENPLEVRCGTGRGSTMVDVLVKEDPVACCPARLIRSISFALEIPEDLRLVQFLAADCPLLDVSTFEGADCLQASVVYLPSVRFDAERVALRAEIEARPGFWPDGFSATQRVVGSVAACEPGVSFGASYLDGRVVPFVNGAEASVAFTVKPHCPTFRRGDVNASGDVDIADPIFLLGWLYGGSNETPPCLDAADANDDGDVNIADPIKILTYLYASGQDLPFPSAICGRDPTPSSTLDCTRFTPCEG